MTEIVKPTGLDNELLEKANAKKEQFKLDMIKYGAIWRRDENNDYPYFLYLASIMNYIEYHNGGCLTEWGMKSLELDISPYIKQIQTGEPKPLSQKDLVRFLLNLMNSYATTFLCKGLFDLCNEDPVKFFELNDFPTAIRDDFLNLSVKAEVLIPSLKKVLDVYCPMLEGKYRTFFNEEKGKGYIKQIFGTQVISSNRSFMPSELKNAKEVK